MVTFLTIYKTYSGKKTIALKGKTGLYSNLLVKPILKFSFFILYIFFNILCPNQNMTGWLTVTHTKERILDHPLIFKS